MEQWELREWESKCVQEEMPQCRAACPLQVDVRAFMERMSAGEWAAARKVLERHMPLPGFLARICDHVCENACLREELGGAVRVGDLEKACVHRVGQQSRLMPVPAKPGRAAVLGDDLAALVAAWDLGRKGWQVTLFHNSAEVGQGLCQRWGKSKPEADLRAALDEELSVLRRCGVDFQVRATTQKFDSPGLQSLTEQAEFAGFNVFFVEADQTNLVQADIDSLTLLAADNVCVGGWNRQSPVHQAAEGRRAAATLERMLSGVSLTAVREKEGSNASRLFTPLAGVQAVPVVQATGPVYSAEEAQAEAGRCLRCECMACVKECAYLKEYKGYPKSYVRQIYNNGAIIKGQHLANSLINGCTLCGQCATLCPNEFSMADLCLQARRDMVTQKYMPPSAHEFALLDMAVSNSELCVLTLPAQAEPGGAGQGTHSVFFPGCQLSASRGGQVWAAYTQLQESLGQVGLMLRCCGTPALWAGREELFADTLAALRAEWEALGQPRMIVACASCLKMFREHAADIPVISLWEVLAELVTEKKIENAEFLDRMRHLPTLVHVPAEGLSIHDPCSARHDTAWQSAVRTLLAVQGIAVQEPELSAEKTACCGYGGLVWNAQPQLAAKMAAHRAAQLPLTAVASCAMCRDRLVQEGKACWHIVDFLFLPHCCEVTEYIDPLSHGPGLSARRAARAQLKRVALRSLGVPMKKIERLKPEVLVPADVLERIEAQHILEEDVATVVRLAEADAQRFYDQQSGHFLASCQRGNVTFWVEYAPISAQELAQVQASGNGASQPEFVIHDAYSHRMIVPGSGVREQGSTATPGREVHA